ncbi:MAG: hypothetical protein H6742_20145 [Alphaproteobacteria bacterium]|nr:hypothetical protein [Alphaproteobacteria bacterium]
MDALLLLMAWTAAGVVVATRGARPAWERVLAVAFWPFFLAASLAPAAETAPVATEPPSPSPVQRLRQALPAGDPALATVAALDRALSAQQARLSRLDRALAELVDGPDAGVDAALDAARGQSRALLSAARERERAALSEALAAVELTATRLWLLRETGEQQAMGALLDELAARLGAAEEVDAAAIGVQGLAHG